MFRVKEQLIWQTRLGQLEPRSGSQKCRVKREEIDCIAGGRNERDDPSAEEAS